MLNVASEKHKSKYTQINIDAYKIEQKEEKEEEEEEETHSQTHWLSRRRFLKVIDNIFIVTAI